MQAHLRALSHTFLAHHYSPMHTTVWPCAHQHNPLDFFFLTAERPSSNNTLSRSQIPVWICPDKNAPQEGDWASVSAGLFWGISLAHLFDPKHSALSPPEQCSGALGRNQDVILNWLKGKVCLDLSFLFFYIFRSLALSLHCAAPFFTKASLIFFHATASCPSADSIIENMFWTKTQQHLTQLSFMAFWKRTQKAVFIMFWCLWWNGIEICRNPG